jgi:hypothetical protein
MPQGVEHPDEEMSARLSMVTGERGILGSNREACPSAQPHAGVEIRVDCRTKKEWVWAEGENRHKPKSSWE